MFRMTVMLALSAASERTCAAGPVGRVSVADMAPAARLEALSEW